MILVFGGTTEGRKAAEVLEEAGTPYYYSTRGDGQQIELVNGCRLTGEMDVPQMVECSREYGIRLIIDAAHPFAEELHRNLLFLAKQINAPVIRYERIFPPHTDDVVWCRDYQDAMARMEAAGVDRLLALTGVNNICTLRPYWEKHECWFRILNRRLSQTLARKSQFPEDHLVYYEEDETETLIRKLHPQAILTKESGLSGGFSEKVETAKRAGVRVFVIERPAYPPPAPVPQDVRIERVNGPHGLRRAVEHLLHAFFPLHSGLTTGTCATAAAVAATRQLMQGETPAEVQVLLPDGETISVAVGYGEKGNPDKCGTAGRQKGCAYCIKEAGDDPDVTNGLEIWAEAEPAGHFEILGGEGVGRFTLPGFDYPPGEPAINKGPREMMRMNIREKVRITVSVPQGAGVAHRTFNPRLGIEGGISIIGVSGIVKPFSEEAFVNSIGKCMQVAKASGTDCVVINSGAKSERFLKDLYPCLPRQAFVQYGNYIGETLRMAAGLGFKKVVLGVMLGKAVKLAQGHLDTHSRKAVMDKDFVSLLLCEAGCDTDISNITLARELWDMLPEDKRDSFSHTVIAHCLTHCRPLFPDGELTVFLIDDNGHIFRS